MRKRYRILALLGIAALLFPLIAACGGDDDDAEPLKIGTVLPMTGDLSDFGPSLLNSAKLAVMEINEAGGVNGQDIELVEGDSGTSPQVGVEEARRLIEVEGVSAILGAGSSGVSLQIVESVTGPEEVLQISCCSTSPALTDVNDNDFFFRVTVSDAAQGVVLADLATELGFTKICTMYTNNAYGEGLSNNFDQAFTANGGTITAAVPHDQQQASYSSELALCAEQEPEAMAAISYPESARVYLREAIEAGTVPAFLFTDGTKSDTMFADLGWENFDGMSGTAPGFLQSEQGTGFDERYEAEYGELPPLPFMRETYDAVYLFALAAEKAGSVDSIEMRDNLRDVSNAPGEAVYPGVEGFENAIQLIEDGTDIDYVGAAGTHEFDANGDVLTGGIDIWHVEGETLVTTETREINLAP